MTPNPERLRRIAIAVYALPFVARVVLSLIHSRAGDLGDMVILAVVALTPAILYFCGVRWCRYVVGVFSILFLLLWLVTPMALHAIDRTGGFWPVWCAVLLAFTFSSIMAFIRDKGGNHAVEPTK